MLGRDLNLYVVVSATLSYATTVDQRYASSENTESITHIRLMTWNVENLDRNAASQHKSSVKKSLQSYVSHYSPDIIALQEIEKCSLIIGVMAGYECIDTTIPPDIEANVQTVLGGIILHKASIFMAKNPNRVESDTQWRRQLHHRKDKYGKTISFVHTQRCTWGAYNGCSSVHKDFLRTNSVELFPNGNQWQPEFASALKDGLRVFGVHLFSGVRIHGLSDDMRAARRSFQMRSLMWLTDLWNTLDGTQLKTMTAYLGDFNTRSSIELRDVLAVASDYGMKPWCPADGGSCAKAESIHKTHKAGYLDHIVFDMHPKTWDDTINVTISVLQQQGNHHSDHNPLLLQLTYLPPSPGKPSPGNDDSHVGSSPDASFMQIFLISLVVLGSLAVLLAAVCLWYKCARKQSARTTRGSPAFLPRPQQQQRRTEMSFPQHWNR